MSELTKPEARERADELEIEYTSKTPVSELRELIAAKEAELAEAEKPAEEPEAPADAEPENTEPEVPADTEEASGELLKKIEGSEVISVVKEGNRYQVQAANGCGYTLPESEYETLLKSQ
jgi:hypothetical protein